MFRNSAIRVGALTLWLTSSLVGVADAQVAPPRGQRTFYCTSGLFTLTIAGTLKFNISLDSGQRPTSRRSSSCASSTTRASSRSGGR